MKISTPQITASEVEKLYQNEVSSIFLDVRTKAEFTRGHLPKAINLPLDELSSRINELPKNTNTKIIAYCLSGSRSSEAVNFLIHHGFTNAHSVTSGLLALRATTIPVVT